jgi:hypothetical protein
MRGALDLNSLSFMGIAGLIPAIFGVQGDANK